MFYKPQFMCISLVLDQTLFIGVNWRAFSMVFVDKPGSGRIRSLILLYLGSAHFSTGSGLKFGLFCSEGSNRGSKWGFDGGTASLFKWLWSLTCQIFKNQFYVFYVWPNTNNNRYIKIRIHFLPISSGSIIHLKKNFSIKITMINEILLLVFPLAT